MIWSRELYVDATKVLANADIDSLVPRFYHEAMTHVADLFATDAVRDEHDDAADPPTGDEVASSAGVVQSVAAKSEQSPRWKLLEERRLDPHRPAVGSYRRTSDFRAS